MKNYVRYTFYFTLSVLAILLLMSFMPSLTLFGHTFRKVDILSEIRTSSDEEEDEEDSDSVFVAPPIVKPAFVDTCRAGMTCIEDYSDSTMRGMTAFYKALDQVHTLNRPVRIAVFGDSFIEADILTADLRENLQNKYGGCGVGYVDIASGTNGFRPSVRHSFGGWQSHAQSDTAYFVRSKQGIAGRYFIPSAGSYVELKGQTKYASRLDTCQQSTIYFYNSGNLELAARVNGGEEIAKKFTANDKMQTMSVEGEIGAIRWRVKNTGPAVFYGATMEGKKGITVDNLSMRGSSGLAIAGIPEKALKDFDELRSYDLIILQYGLNVATRNGKDYSGYQKGMIRSVEHLKKCFPNTAILLLSVGDRDYKTGAGELKTMPGVKNLIAYQQSIAAETGIAFWNMFEAMGGEASMANLVKAKPSLANYDYTHINFKGGKYLADLLYETLIYGKEQYDRRRAYEKDE